MSEIKFSLREVYTKAELNKLENLSEELNLAITEKHVLRRSLRDICRDLENGEHVDLDWVTEHINDAIINEVSLLHHRAITKIKDSKINELEQQLKESNELLKEACKYLQQETDLGKDTASSYGVDSKMFGYYEFLNKPEVKKIIGDSDE